MNSKPTIIVKQTVCVALAILLNSACGIRNAGVQGLLASGPHEGSELEDRAYQALLRGEIEQSAALLLKAINEMEKRHDDAIRLGIAYLDLANCLELSRNYSGAIAALEKAESLFRKCDDGKGVYRSSIAIAIKDAMVSLARLYSAASMPQKSVSEYDRAIAFSEKNGLHESLEWLQRERKNAGLKLSAAESKELSAEKLLHTAFTEPRLGLARALRKSRLCRNSIEAKSVLKDEISRLKKDSSAAAQLCKADCEFELAGFYLRERDNRALNPLLLDCLSTRRKLLWAGNPDLGSTVLLLALSDLDAGKSDVASELLLPYLDDDSFIIPLGLKGKAAGCFLLAAERYCKQSKPELARLASRRALLELERPPRNSDGEIVAGLVHLATAFILCKDYKKADEILVRAIALGRKGGRGTAPFLPGLLTLQAQVRQAKGDLASSLELALQALHEQEALSGVDSAATIPFRVTVADLFFFCNNMAEALRNSQQIVSMELKLGDSADPKILANAYAHMADCYGRMGQLEKSREFKGKFESSVRELVRRQSKKGSRGNGDS